MSRCGPRVPRPRPSRTRKNSSRGRWAAGGLKYNLADAAEAHRVSGRHLGKLRADGG
jgi:hypothetical protein